MQDPLGDSRAKTKIRLYVAYVFRREYGKEIVKRVKGIEPSLSAWKAVALPLSYTRKLCDKKTGASNDISRLFYAVALFAKQTSA